jgi:addiction module HigA family antidote
MSKKNEVLPLPHPGETLQEDFMKPLGLSAPQVAKGLGVHPLTVSLLARGRRSITPELALRLARYTGASADFWLGLQEEYDLRNAERQLASRIAREVRLCPLLENAAPA